MHLEKTLRFSGDTRHARGEDGTMTMGKKIIRATKTK